MRKRPRKKRGPNKAKIARIVAGLPLNWDYPLLVVDRSYLPKCLVSRLEIRDTDPEKVCVMIEKIAKALRPPEALWYVEPANPKKVKPKD